MLGQIEWAVQNGSVTKIGVLPVDALFCFILFIYLFILILFQFENLLRRVI